MTDQISKIFIGMNESKTVVEGSAEIGQSRWTFVIEKNRVCYFRLRFVAFDDFKIIS